MINISIKKNNKQYQEFIFKGHALYDDYGKDIVCAGVSSVLITTVNAIIRYDEKAITKLNEKNNTIHLIINKNDKIITLLLDNMSSLLKELEVSYPKNISIREDESDV